MSWTSAEDIRRQLERRWKTGDILRSLLHGGSVFPLQLRVSVPSSREIALDFSHTQRWIEMLRTLPGIRIEWKDIQSQMIGKQQVPKTLWVDTPMDAVAHLSAESATKTFLHLHTATGNVLPELIPWVESHPLRVIFLEPVWNRLLQVAMWKKHYPTLQPLYVRQVDLPGVDTKFIENNATVLSEMFDVVVPSETYVASSDDFRTRHGFLREPARIRFRILDPRINFAGLSGYPDVELDEGSFALLRLPARRVFVTENKTNFLAFPYVDDSIIIFGSGYGMRALSRAEWMRSLPLYYWGDIDTHGFAILSQMRAVFPNVKSFLMDEQTLLQHEASWIHEPSAARHQVENLSASEKVVFDGLLAGGTWRGVRLEQEKMALSTVSIAIQTLLEEEGRVK